MMPVTCIARTIDELQYRSYATQRQYFPEVSPQRWAAIYSLSADQLAYCEARFQHWLAQQELNQYIEVQAERIAPELVAA